MTHNLINQLKNKKLIIVLAIILAVLLFLYFYFLKNSLKLNFSATQSSQAQIISGGSFTIKKEDGCACSSTQECFGGYCCFRPGSGSLCSSSPCPATISDLNSDFNFACFQSRIPRLSWNTSATTPYELELQICKNSSCSDAQDPLINISNSANYNSFWSAPCSGACNSAPYNKIEFGGKTYYWRIRIKDSSGAWSDWALANFTTKQNAYPLVSFTCNNVNCNSLKPSVGELITLKDNSQYFSSSISCQWQLPPNLVVEEGDINSCELKARVTAQQNAVITLNVTDSSGNGPCLAQETLQLKPRLPIWREIFQ